VKIDLLAVVDEITGAGIDELIIATIARKVADIFDERK
jgi:hypothetical protein